MMQVKSSLDNSAISHSVIANKWFYMFLKQERYYFKHTNVFFTEKKPPHLL